MIGERWALLIVRELAFGPKRFTDLRGALGASPNVLSQRLGELEEAGVVQRRSAGAALYELTDWGRELHPILVQLGRWGAHSKLRPRGALSVDSLMLALEATFVPDAAPELVASYELRLGEDQFSVDIDRGSIAIARGHERRAVAILETESETLRAVVFGEQKLADAPVVIRGDARLGRLFFRLFSRP